MARNVLRRFSLWLKTAATASRNKAWLKTVMTRPHKARPSLPTAQTAPQWVGPSPLMDRTVQRVVAQLKRVLPRQEKSCVFETCRTFPSFEARPGKPY